MNQITDKMQEAMNDSLAVQTAFAEYLRAVSKAAVSSENLKKELERVINQPHIIIDGEYELDE